MRGSKGLAVGFFFFAGLWSNGKNPVVHIHSSTGSVAIDSAPPQTKSSRTNNAKSNYEMYVNNATGSDSNSGTRSGPFKTIGKALQIAQDNYRNGASVRIIIAPGTYRESLSLSGGSSGGSAGIILEAEKAGTAILSGSDIWADWQPDAADSKRYMHAWPFQWGPCTAPQGSPPLEEIVRRREIVFVNGNLLIQALSRNEMAEGSFFVDEPGRRIYIWPPSATNMANAVIEVPVRPRLLDVRHMSNLTVRDSRSSTRTLVCL